jgi:hypothetical protein
LPSGESAANGAALLSVLRGWDGHYVKD